MPSPGLENQFGFNRTKQKLSSRVVEVIRLCRDLNGQMERFCLVKSRAGFRHHWKLSFHFRTEIWAKADGEGWMMRERGTGREGRDMFDRNRRPSGKTIFH